MKQNQEINSTTKQQNTKSQITVIIPLQIISMRQTEIENLNNYKVLSKQDEQPNKLESEAIHIKLHKQNLKDNSDST